MMSSPYDGFLTPGRRDALVAMAASRLGVEAATFSIIGLDHQFRLSCHGIPLAGTSEGPVPLHQSLCATVAETGMPVLVENGPEHPVFRGHAAVRELGLIAYLGVPVERVGRVVAVLAVMSAIPRRWTKGDVGTLMDLLAAQHASERAGALSRSTG